MVLKLSQHNREGRFLILENHRIVPFDAFELKDFPEQRLEAELLLDLVDSKLFVSAGFMPTADIGQPDTTTQRHHHPLRMVHFFQSTLHKYG